jgi:hypothetical protein
VKISQVNIAQGRDLKDRFTIAVGGVGLGSLLTEHRWVWAATFVALLAFCVIVKYPEDK